MPPFQYERYQNPFVSSISALLEQPGQIEAQRAQTIGNAQANAALQGGQAWGNAIQGAGQAVSGAVELATDPKRREYERQQQGRQVLTQVLKTTPPNADGSPNHSAIVAALGAKGFPDVGEAWLSSDVKNRENIASLAKMKQDAVIANQNVQKKQMETIGDAAHHADTPEKFLATVGYLAAHQQIDEKTANQAMDAAQSGGPDGWKAVRAQFLQYSPEYQDIQKQKNAAFTLPPTPEGAAPAQRVVGGQSIATGGQSQPKPPTETEVAMKAADGDAAAAMSLLKPKPVESAQSVDKLLDGKPTTLMFDPKTKQYTNASGQVIENAATRIKPIPSASAIALNAGNLSDVALEQAAQKYLETGILPPGFGTAGVLQKTAIMNKAALLDPKAALARNQAVFKADQANLTKLQTTEGTLSAFERTAGKNLDQFLTTAAKVPDTGVPWINAPIRTLNAKLLGSADQAAFNAARDVALREIARVTNDPKLSGALTDSARAEVSALSPATATFAQIKRVAQILKQDMANVHSGLTEQIASVKSGIGQNPNAAAPAEAPRVRKYNPATGKLE